MEDKSFKEAIKELTENMAYEIMEEVKQSVFLYAKNEVYHPNGRTIKQITDHLSSDFGRQEAVRQSALYIYIRALIDMHFKNGALNQEQFDELTGFLDNLVTHITGYQKYTE